MKKLTDLLDEIKDLLVSLDTRLQRIEQKLKDVSDYEINVDIGMHESATSFGEMAKHYAQKG